MCKQVINREEVIAVEEYVLKHLDGYLLHDPWHEPDWSSSLGLIVPSPGLLVMLKYDLESSHYAIGDHGTRNLRGGYVPRGVYMLGPTEIQWWHSSPYFIDFIPVNSDCDPSGPYITACVGKVGRGRRIIDWRCVQKIGITKKDLKAHIESVLLVCLRHLQKRRYHTK